MKGKEPLAREDAAERLGAIVAGLATVAEQPSVRDELIDAWTAADGDRFRAVIEAIPLPDYVPPEVRCFFVCDVVEVAIGLVVVEVYRWAATSRRLTDQEVQALESAVIPTTGQSALAYLIAIGIIERSTEFEIIGGEGKKCSEICFGPIPPGPVPGPSS